MDVRCGTRVEDVSVEPNHSSLPKDIETLKEEDLQSLGLMLLGHIAKDIEHIHIKQFAFISFEIPRQKSG